MGVESVLRQMIQDRIIAEVPVLDGRVYDRTSEDDPFPNVTMGPGHWLPADAECVAGELWTGQIDVWHRDVDKGIAGDVTKAVAAALRGWRDTVLLTMTPFRIAMIRQMDEPDGISTHGIIQVETRVESSP